MKGEERAERRRMRRASQRNEDMLRSWARLGRGLLCFGTPRSGAKAAIGPTAALHHSSHNLQGSSTLRVLPLEKDKDWAVPNPSWSREMVHQFNRFEEMSKDGSWQKLPSYRSLYHHLPEKHQGRELRKRGNRFFLRSIDQEGMGFEYVMFLNTSEKRMACVVQIGPYLEGYSGFAHGGSIAAILDNTLGGCAIYISSKVMTANLSINYKNPITLGSVILVDSRLVKMEGRKIFISGEVRSADGQTLHAEATGLFIQM